MLASTSWRGIDIQSGLKSRNRRIPAQKRKQRRERTRASFPARSAASRLSERLCLRPPTPVDTSPSSSVTPLPRPLPLAIPLPTDMSPGLPCAPAGELQSNTPHWIQNCVSLLTLTRLWCTKTCRAPTTFVSERVDDPEPDPPRHPEYLPPRFVVAIQQAALGHLRDDTRVLHLEALPLHHALAQQLRNHQRSRVQSSFGWYVS